MLLWALLVACNVDCSVVFVPVCFASSHVASSVDKAHNTLSFVTQNGNVKHRLLGYHANEKQGRLSASKLHEATTCEEEGIVQTSATRWSTEHHGGYHMVMYSHVGQLPSEGVCELSIGALGLVFLLCIYDNDNHNNNKATMTQISRSCSLCSACGFILHGWASTLMSTLVCYLYLPV